MHTQQGSAEKPTGNGPTFFIIGAAKAGTTSLFYYLRQHPRLFFPSVKELNYFSTGPAHSGALVCPGRGPGDREATLCTRSLAEYEARFEDQQAEQIAGEASVSYLYSPVTAARLSNRVPEAKLIAVLRNPVDRAWSNYCHMVRDGRERLDFVDALQEEDARIAEGWEFSWHYKRLGRYGEQLARFYDAFPAEQIKVFLFEELKADAEGVTREILSFLGVDPQCELEIGGAHNRSGAVRSTWVARLISRPNWLTWLARRVIPLSVGHRLMEVARALNQSKEKPEMPEAARASLTRYYARDLARAGDLIGRDLSHWTDDAR